MTHIRRRMLFVAVALSGAGAVWYLTANREQAATPAVNSRHTRASRPAELPVPEGERVVVKASDDHGTALVPPIHQQLDGNARATGVTYCGRLIDDDGQPIPGALISVLPKRIGRFGHTPSVPFDDPCLQEQPNDGNLRLGPGQPAFELRVGEESLSFADGSFAVESERSPNEILAWAATGEWEIFPLRAAHDERRVDGFVLKMPRKTVLTIEPVDSREARIDIGEYIVSLLVKSDVDDQLWASGQQENGLIEFLLDCRASAIQELALELPGYLPARIRVDGSLVSGQRLRWMFERTPTFPIRVLLHLHAADVALPTVPELELVACRKSPPELERDPSCCGLGASHPSALPEQPIRLEVKSDAPHWIYLKGSFVSGERAIYGPFEPGDMVRDISVPQVAKRSAPIASDQIGEGSITVQIVDAATQLRLTFGALRLDLRPRNGPVLENAWAFELKAADDGTMHADRIPAGLHAGVIAVPGYQWSDKLHFQVSNGQASDLGQVRVTTAGSFGGRVVEADGSPPQRSWQVFWVDDGGARLAQAEVDSQGEFRFQRGLPNRATLEVREEWQGLSSSVQRFVVAGSEGRAVPLIRLRPWCSVELRIVDVPVPLQSASIALDVEPLGEPWSRCNNTPSSGTDAAWIYELNLAEGRYRVTGHSVAFELEETVIALKPGVKLVVPICAR